MKGPVHAISSGGAAESAVHVGRGAESAAPVGSRPIRPKRPWAPTLPVPPFIPALQAKEESADEPFFAPAPDTFESTLQASRGGGDPLPPDTRATMEGAFGADFTGVRVHTDTAAVRMNQQLGARAFTYGPDIYFNAGQYEPGSRAGRHLLAHELTHTLQQGGMVRRRAYALTPSPLMVQGFGVLDLLPDWVVEGVRHIPGYTLFTFVIAYDPLRQRPVERTPIALLEGLMGLVPFGTAIFDKLREYGIIERAFAWASGQLDALGLSAASLLDLLEEAWDELEFPYTEAIEVISGKFQRLLRRIRSFAEGLVDQLMDWIREALVDVAEPYLAENRAWQLITKILRYDPLRDQPVEASTVEILEDFLLLIGRETELEQMRERGTLQETADWLDTQLATFLDLLGTLRGLIDAAWAAIQPENLAAIGERLLALAGRVTGFLQRVWDFATTVAAKVLALVKNALLGWLNSFAADIPGFTLLTVILGRNPLTDEMVPRSVENLIRGFMGLVPGGEAKFQELRETGVVPRAAAQIEALVAELGISWAFVRGLFTGLWESLSIDDLVEPLATFQRVVDQFGEPIARLFAFVARVVRVLVELVLEIMGFPTDLIAGIIANAMAAIEDIKNDPIAFLVNLMNAIKAGFLQFFSNFGTHLLQGFQNWLFGTLGDAGIQIPPDFSFRSILGLVFEILGITVDNVLDRLALQIGPERVEQLRSALDTLTGIWAFVRDVIERGPIAIWEYVQEQLSNLWAIIRDGIMGFVMERVVAQAVSWLLSFLDVTGIMPVIRGTVAVFNAIQSFIEQLRAMLEIVGAFVAGVAEIARGSIESAANFLERALADGIPIAIAFLARQLGLGNIGERIQAIIAAVRERINAAIDWLIERALRLGGAVLSALGLGGGAEGDEAEAEATAEAVAEGDYIYEETEGGHTIRITRNLAVFRFSDPEQLAGEAALAEKQEALEQLVPRQAPAYPVDSLGRAAGPTGHVSGVKAGEERLNLPALSTLPGGAAAYLPGDHRGHLIGDRFFGSNANGNLVPMNPTLNLSTFKTYENRLASKYNELLGQGKPALIYMDLSPTYPGNDPSQSSHYRPERVAANCQVITLRSGANALEAEEFNFPDSFSNPPPVLTAIDPNEADLTELRQAFRREFADLIFQERERNGRFGGEHDFIWRISLQLGREAQIERVSSMLASREYLIVF